ncbi:hypothetical protein SUGI_0468530 [Cryptomeria japonica]|nr:hypothetical protein SUGI_0468530 [Cryptomeria japonica]
MMTFDNSSFLGNPNLWGCPLEMKCSHPPPKPSPPSKMDVKEDGEEEFPWYEISVGLSVGMGFSTVVMVLALKDRWRTALATQWTKWPAPCHVFSMLPMSCVLFDWTWWLFLSCTSHQYLQSVQPLFC